MSRRKGELTPNAVDRGWPHQVILPESQCVLERGKIISDFCRALSLAPRGHTVVKEGEWHRVFCFSEKADAEKMIARFGGEQFDPTTRGRGHKWHLLKNSQPHKSAR